MNDSKKTNTERNSVDIGKKILDHLKSGPVKGKNEIAVQKKLGEVLKVDVEEIKRIIASLAKDGRITKSTFISYSATTKSSTPGFAISVHHPKTSKQKLPKTPSANSRIQIVRVPTKPKEPLPPPKEWRRINGQNMKSVDDQAMSYVESRSGPCRCRAAVIRMPKSDMRNGTRSVLCRCTSCGRTWSEGSG